jgi:hypothetical protein
MLGTMLRQCAIENILGCNNCNHLTSVHLETNEKMLLEEAPSVLFPFKKKDILTYIILRSCSSMSHPGFSDPNANIITRYVETKSHTYDESWYRNKCYNFTI